MRMVNYATLVSSVIRAMLLMPAMSPVHAFDEWVPKDLSLVLEATESIDDGGTRHYFGDWCYIDFPLNGSFRSGVFGSAGLWTTAFGPHNVYSWRNPGSRSLCSSSPVRYKLQNDGNFVIQCTDDHNDGTVDYATHSHQVVTTTQNDTTTDFFMAVDSSCELLIFQGTFNTSDDELKEIWSNNKYGSWQVNERLYKGQIYHGLSYYEMILNPSDRNLEVHRAQSHGTYDVVWSAQDEWEEAPSDKFHDFYARLEPSGTLILVRIESTPEGLHNEVYFSKDLKLDNETDGCYSLGFELLEWDFIDLIAVPCAD